MSIRVLLDGDAVSKLARWNLLNAALQALGVTPQECATLDTVRYRFQLSDPVKAARRCGSRAAADRLKSFVEALGKAPAPDPLTVAALAGATDVDAGEAVLVGQLAVLTDAFLVTGDKRALRALVDPRNGAIAARVAGRLLSLEQLLTVMIRKVEIDQVRAGILNDLHCDIAVRNAFGSRGDAPDSSVREGLQSYIRDLRQEAGNLLADEATLV